MKRMSKIRRRRRRLGEYVCRCQSYKFPHREGGGRCDPGYWAEVERLCPTCGGSGGGDEHWRCHACNGSGERLPRRVLSGGWF